MSHPDQPLDQLVPLELERAWRRDPVAFRAWLDQALVQQPDSSLLQAWQVRLDFPAAPASPAPTSASPAEPGTNGNLLLYTVLVATVVWAAAKLPDFTELTERWFYPRFIPWLVISGLVSWFLLRGKGPRGLLLQSAGIRHRCSPPGSGTRSCSARAGWRR